MPTDAHVDCDDRPLSGHLRSFFAVCKSKFIKLSRGRGLCIITHVQEWSQFATPFDDFLLRSADIRDKIAKLSDIEFEHKCFWAAEVLGGGTPNFWQNFITLDHRRTCGKAWWWLTTRPGRLGGEKQKEKKKELNDRSCWTALNIHVNNVISLYYCYYWLYFITKHPYSP